MSILVDKNTRVLTQGITGATGQLHTRACKEYGTQMVGGVVPGKGGTDFEGIPIFDTVEQARKATGCNATVIYVPPAFAADAMLEAVAAGIELVICITEGVPVLDMVKVKALHGGHQVAPDRTQLPGNHHAGRVQNRHHAGIHPQAGRHRRGFAIGHADLRGGVPADATRNRTIELHRNRRRSDRRHRRISTR